MKPIRSVLQAAATNYPPPHTHKTEQQYGLKLLKTDPLSYIIIYNTFWKAYEHNFETIKKSKNRLQ
jgi:hypothetical protein